MSWLVLVVIVCLFFFMGGAKDACSGCTADGGCRFSTSKRFDLVTHVRQSTANQDPEDKMRRNRRGAAEQGGHH